MCGSVSAQPGPHTSGTTGLLVDSVCGLAGVQAGWPELSNLPARVSQGELARPVARKSTGGASPHPPAFGFRKAPRSQLRGIRIRRRTQPAGLQCAYNVGGPPDNHSSSSSSQESGSELDDLATSLATTCQRAGIAPSQQVDLDLDPATVHACAQLGLPDWDGVAGLRHGFPQKVELRALPNRPGALRVVAKHTILKEQLIGVMAGKLQELSKWEVALPSTDDELHLWGWDIFAKDLAQRFGYPAGGPDLVLNMLESGNELRFAQDATWVHGPNTRRNNATAWLGVGPHPTARIPGTNTPLPVPLVMVYADRRIRAGQEVQFSWGEDTWQRHQQIQVVRQGHANHVLYLRLHKMQQLLDGYNASGSCAGGSFRSKGISLCLEEDARQGAAVEGASGVPVLAPGMAGAAGASAMAAAPPQQATAANRATTSGSSSARLNAGDRSAASQGGAMHAQDSQQQQQQEQQLRIMSFHASGCRWFYEDDQNALDELEELGKRVQVGCGTSVHPSRGFRALGQQEVLEVFPGLGGPSFPELPQGVMDAVDEAALEARLDEDPGQRSIVHRFAPRRTWPPTRWWRRWTWRTGRTSWTMKGCTGLGRTRTSATTTIKQAYMFSITKEDLQAFGLPCNGPEWDEGLVIDSRESGNIARFINCCWGRAPEEPGEPSHINVVAFSAWNLDTHRPVVRLRAGRRIRKGEELVMDYGSSYWGIIARALMIEQRAYAHTALTREAALKAQLQQRLAAGALSTRAYEEVCSYQPDLESMQLFSP